MSAFQPTTLAALAGEQIVSQLQDALIAARADFPRNVERVQEILSDLVDRMDAYRVVRSLDVMAEHRLSVAV